MPPSTSPAVVSNQGKNHPGLKVVIPSSSSRQVNFLAFFIDYVIDQTSEFFLFFKRSNGLLLLRTIFASAVYRTNSTQLLFVDGCNILTEERTRFLKAIGLSGFFSNIEGFSPKAVRDLRE